MRFQTHYTRDEARALLPSVRKWLKRLVQLKTEMEQREKRLTALSAAGKDTGGPIVNAWVRALAEIKSVLLEFHQREIQVKDFERGLIDFPAIIDDRVVFLCWEQDEDDIEFWHDLDAGYAGRERFSD
ncbi:MAG TPA: DUF2203 domain-containing protein [Candidatus Dormibacteraeota bacterium]|nr:DUF2203 domain-containing protein [Candidatus Dormibacteraeota bacterium]